MVGQWPSQPGFVSAEAIEFKPQHATPLLLFRQAQDFPYI
jgi:hypothetical protein